ncbi:MAG: alpha/beta hydrolase [Hyphomonadaceae bacterium]|nr:alpha/beta hydrolase [Hyphomonadaceae bacterium]
MSEHAHPPCKIVRDPVVDSIVGLETFRVIGPDEKSVRVAFAPHQGANPRGSVIISPGRTEYIEKHATTALELIARGFNVAIIDQRGQGWSDRLTAIPMAGHMDSFQKAAQHLGIAIEAIGARLTGPHLLLCHSMGGCIGLEGLLRGDLPTIQAAAFSAPMWGLNVPFYARPMSSLLSSIQQKCKPLPPTTPITWKPDAFEGNAVTHDPLAFARNNALFLAEPALQYGGPTNGWLREAFTTMQNFTPERLANLALHVLIVSGEADTVVDNAAHVRIAGQLPYAVLRTIAGAKHEILHEIEPYRSQFWNHFDHWSQQVTVL